LTLPSPDLRSKNGGVLGSWLINDGLSVPLEPEEAGTLTPDSHAGLSWPTRASIFIYTEPERPMTG
jgi:hypothetical protein